MTRTGFSLHEMLVSLALLGVVLGLAAHSVARHARLFRGIDQFAVARDHRAHTSAIADRVLWGISPVAGDLMAAHDSALDVRMPIGTAVVCAGYVGRLVVPAPDTSAGNTLTAFVDAPQPGDRISALFADSLGATWLTLHVATSPVADACARFPGVAAAWSIATNEALAVPAGAVLRFSRPLRLALYRASDSQWYLGAREWNAAQQTFNTIQPVVGPLQEFSLVYHDSAGHRLVPPLDASRVASVTIVTHTLGDSSTVTVALRNSR
jgi:prepilin-type N-terminal cleavage/methylation domain-containing protein